MIVERVSPRTGKVNYMDLDITEAQVEKYQKGALIQDAFPNLAPHEREFIMTGYTQEDWNSIFGDEDDDGDING